MAGSFRASRTPLGSPREACETVGVVCDRERGLHSARAATGTRSSMRDVLAVGYACCGPAEATRAGRVPAGQAACGVACQLLHTKRIAETSAHYEYAGPLSHGCNAQLSIHWFQELP